MQYVCGQSAMPGSNHNSRHYIGSIYAMRKNQGSMLTRSTSSFDTYQIVAIIISLVSIPAARSGIHQHTVGCRHASVDSSPACDTEPCRRKWVVCIQSHNQPDTLICTLHTRKAFTKQHVSCPAEKAGAVAKHRKKDIRLTSAFEESSTTIV